MSDFTAILLEGLFYERNGSLYVEQVLDGSHVSVQETLEPVLGKRVQFAIHHVPPNGIEPNLPGAGSCRFPGGRGCPAGHEGRPDRLISFHMEGVLRADPWRVEKFDGSHGVIPFGAMPGHFGRVGAATVVDVEKMREHLAGLDPAALAAAGLGAQDLEAIIARLRRSMET